jgi:mannose-6-phosphate isomerase-like protein (cupin superfamily)
MKIQKADWSDIIKQMSGPWASTNLVQSRNGSFKVRVMENYEAPWHEHPDSDEIFIVLSGNLEIDVEADSYFIFPGQIFLVPSGTRHRSRAKGRVEALVFDDLKPGTKPVKE